MTIGRFGLRRRNYDFPPYRPPSEAESLLVRVTRGCPWNKCTFCFLYRGTKFEIRDEGEILEDIEMAKDLYRDRVQSIFIGDSNSLVVKTEMLVRVLKALTAAFPRAERITSYARAKTLAKKPVEELISLRQAGLTRLHVGLESGDGEILKETQKGATPEEMIEAGKKAKEAGFEYSLYVLMGLGGEEKWEQHAWGTAKVLNQIDPHFIRVRTLIPEKSFELSQAMARGDFKPASIETIVKETKLLLENLQGTSQFVSDHVANLLQLYGQLPEDREKMIQITEEILMALQRDAMLKKEMEMRRHLVKNL